MHLWKRGNEEFAVITMQCVQLVPYNQIVRLCTLHVTEYICDYATKNVKKAVDCGNAWSK